MVFSSLPIYLDPSNWQQQQQHNQQSGGAGAGAGTGLENLHLPPHPPPASTGSNQRPDPSGRLAKVQLQPESSAQKCPRCESTNTKFCYFNNYSLSQPRHFCKTCRRYWTRGGALRNVPVGGGFRRNKRSKGSRSKSPATGGVGATSGPASAVSSPSAPPQQLPFYPSLHNLGGFGAAGAGDMGLSFPGGGDVEYFQMGSSAHAQPWRLQQLLKYPFYMGLDQPAGMYQFEGIGGGQPLESGVKVEENGGFNFSRNFLGINEGGDQFWGTGNNNNAYTDLL